VGIVMCDYLLRRFAAFAANMTFFASSRFFVFLECDR